ncbi:MAG: ATP-binding cassette domain-containing protein [Clostridiales bacterium]|nr:ATP-binding cassette domain-containing protein [Clostridiales bacterium]
MIELKNLCKEYATNDGTLVALKDINLKIEDGSIYGIIGLSGAGKSTLVRCINLLERPTSGDVIINGEELTKVKKKRLLELRRDIGMIFQNFNLLEQRTVEANIRFPLELAKEPKDNANKRIKELLKIVGLEDKANAYPSQLSGGQKQRVAIARALATNPKYLLCDEATSALDPNTTTAILDLLKNINHDLGITIVIITHEMRVVESICTHVAVIDKSQIVESGSVSEVFSFPRSQIAKELIIPNLIRSIKSSGNNKLRLVFDGKITDKPIISGLAIECGVAVNILFADTKNIDGKIYGHMVIEVPLDSSQCEKVKDYLNTHNVIFKEEI